MENPNKYTGGQENGAGARGDSTPTISRRSSLAAEPMTAEERVAGTAWELQEEMRVEDQLFIKVYKIYAGMEDYIRRNRNIHTKEKNDFYEGVRIFKELAAVRKKVRRAKEACDTETVAYIQEITEQRESGRAPEAPQGRKGQGKDKMARLQVVRCADGCINIPPTTAPAMEDLARELGSRDKAGEPHWLLPMVRRVATLQRQQSLQSVRSEDSAPPADMERWLNMSEVAERATQAEKRKEISPLEKEKGEKRRKKTKGAEALQQPQYARDAQADKYQDGGALQGWNEVVRRRKKKKVGAGTGIPAATNVAMSGTGERGLTGRNKGPLARPPAVVVKVGQGATYAEVLGKVKREGSEEDMGRVTSMRRTRHGDLLIELARDAAADARKVEQVATRAVGGAMSVHRLYPRMEVVIKDIDEVATPEEVKQAIVKLAKEKCPDMDTESIQIRGMSKGYGGMQRAFVAMPKDTAEVVVTTGRVKIGWVYCRVQAQAAAVRCFRCQRLGHVAAACKKYDREITICRRCGEEGHISAGCEKAPRCLICVERGLPEEKIAHVAASGRCLQLRAEAGQMGSRRTVVVEDASSADQP